VRIHRALGVARIDMVERSFASAISAHPRVLEAMNSVPRHLFVPPEHVGDAYAVRPLPIGVARRFRSRFMVAAMADALLLEGV